jgi:hypothetical protein
MRNRLPLVASILAALLSAPLASSAQMPERKPGTFGVPSAPSVPGVPVVRPPSVPAVPSRDALLDQANGVVGDLTSLRNSGKLAASQAKQVDTLLPKATAVAGELAKPQVETTRLGQLASELNALQQQVTTLKGQVGR